MPNEVSVTKLQKAISCLSALHYKLLQLSKVHPKMGLTAEYAKSRLSTESCGHGRQRLSCLDLMGNRKHNGCGATRLAGDEGRIPFFHFSQGSRMVVALKRQLKLYQIEQPPCAMRIANHRQQDGNAAHVASRQPKERDRSAL